MGKEEPSKCAFFNYQDRPLGDIASCCSYGIVTSKDSRGRLSRVTIHHGAVEYAAGAGWLSCATKTTEGGRMVCQRCGGLLVRETFGDLR